MHASWCLSATLLVLVASRFTAMQPSVKDDAQLSLTQMIVDLARLKEQAPVREQTAYDSAIDELTRLRDHDNWPVINSPVAITSLQSTSWKTKPDANGFQQTLRFTGSTGQWLQGPGLLPMSINWSIESDRIRFSTYAPYQAAFSYQIVDRTYRYVLAGNVLTMTRGDTTLEWFLEKPAK